MAKERNAEKCSLFLVLATWGLTAGSRDKDRVGLVVKQTGVRDQSLGTTENRHN